MDCFDHRLLGVQTSRFLVRAKGGFAFFIINGVSIIQKITSLRQVFDWMLPFLCQFWLKSQHDKKNIFGLWFVFYLLWSSPFSSFFFFFANAALRACLLPLVQPFFHPPPPPHIPALSCVARCWLPVLSSSVWPHTKLQPPLSSVWMCSFPELSLWNGHLRNLLNTFSVFTKNSFQCFWLLSFVFFFLDVLLFKYY